MRQARLESGSEGRASAVSRRLHAIVRCGDGRDMVRTRLFPSQQVPPYCFNSFFSSVRKRQSVPWAMSFWGLDLIIPASCRRRA